MSYAEAFIAMKCESYALTLACEGIVGTESPVKTGEFFVYVIVSLGYTPACVPLTIQMWDLGDEHSIKYNVT